MRPAHFGQVVAALQGVVAALHRHADVFYVAEYRANVFVLDGLRVFVNLAAFAASANCLAFGCAPDERQAGQEAIKLVLFVLKALKAAVIGPRRDHDALRGLVADAALQLHDVAQGR